CTFALKHSALICSHLHSFPTRRSSDLAFLGLPVAFHEEARYGEGTPEVHGPFLGGEHQPGKQQEQHGHQPGQPMPSNGRSTLAHAGHILMIRITSSYRLRRLSSAREPWKLVRTVYSYRSKDCRMALMSSRLIFSVTSIRMLSGRSVQYTLSSRAPSSSTMRAICAKE